ncbi:ATP-dependent DNA helicase MER3 [Microsporum canis]
MAKSPEIQLKHAPPMVQGIRLVSTRELPDRFRTIFPFPVFNAIQSKTFSIIYHRVDNVVLSAPTGSGKTVIMELAICKLVSDLKDTRFKAIYLAPTKSLCSERCRDWRTKFAPLDLQCAELTGDTDQIQIRNVQQASIIITTPEKWDSMTRKWKDHMRLMQLIKLVLIDEVHILKEVRGATLEAIVSRMKSVNSNVRFVALSATVPNSEDIASWLGKDPTNQHLPAHRERFGEEFRPVRLQKFVYGYQSNGNDFAFDRVCEAKLPDILAKHSSKKPILVFCCTRNSAITTSKNLAKLWSSANPPQRLWRSPTKPVQVQNADLSGVVITGVAFHHAGLDTSDRHAIETGFLSGQINVICCTSTLAVGVNLPCHLVVIKNTVSWQDGGCREYADLEMMQMLGRAGRPQFDDSAVGVILTRKERVAHYEKLVAGSEPLESCLHLNLIDHLNAEIGLGTVTDIESAIRWLLGTFFFVRLQRNPTYYKLKEGGNRADEEELLRRICENDLELLQENELVTLVAPLKSTELGDAMARYYVKFDTMRLFLSLPRKAKMSEILSVIAQADEFRDIRLKPGEKSLYKEINKGNGIKFPMKTDINLSAHKITLLIQSELGAVEFPSNEQYQKHRLSFQQDKSMVFSHTNRIIRCIIDCQLARGDAVSARHALELSRSLGAKAWDDSVLQLKQIDQIGIVAVRKLASAGITNMEQLEAAEPLRIETLLSRNPPFGMKLLARVADFPKPRVSLKEVGKDIKPGKAHRVKFSADIGFLNEKVPLFFQKRQIYVCFLAEVSDGRIIDFRRIHANKLQKGQQIVLTTEITNPFQTIICTVMCDEIAGTMRQAELQLTLPRSLFASCKGVIEHNTSMVNGLSTRGSEKVDFAPPETLLQQEDLDNFSDNPLNYSDFIPEGVTALWLLNPYSLIMGNGHVIIDARTKQRHASQPHSRIAKDNIKLERHVEIIDLTKPESTKAKGILHKEETRNPSSKRRGRNATPTPHNSCKRRTCSPLSDDTVDPLQLPFPARKTSTTNHNLLTVDGFGDFESLMGDFESFSSEDDFSAEKRRSQGSTCATTTNDMIFEELGDLYVEEDTMSSNGIDYNSYLNHNHTKRRMTPSDIIPSEKLGNKPCISSFQGNSHEEIPESIPQNIKRKLLSLPANLSRCDTDISSVGHREENCFSSTAESSVTEKRIFDHRTSSGKGNQDVFLWTPSKRRKSDPAITQASMLKETTTYNFQRKPNNPRAKNTEEKIDPLLLQEFGAVAEFY